MNGFFPLSTIGWSMFECSNWNDFIPSHSIHLWCQAAAMICEIYKITMNERSELHNNNTVCVFSNQLKIKTLLHWHWFTQICFVLHFVSMWIVPIQWNDFSENLLTKTNKLLNQKLSPFSTSNAKCQWQIRGKWQK